MELSELKRKLLNTEYVYCLSNTSFSPDILKIGWTRHNPAYRANQLYTTGLPTPFKIEFLILTHEGKSLEGRIHDYFSRCRVSGSREFFKISLSDLQNILTTKFSLKLIQLSDIIEHLPKQDKISKTKRSLPCNNSDINNYSDNEPSYVDKTELENMFAKFRYEPSPPNSPRENINMFEKFKYRPTSS